MLTTILGMTTGAFALGLGAAAIEQDDDLDSVLEGKSPQGVKAYPADKAPPAAPQGRRRDRPYRDDDYRRDRDRYGRERTISCRSTGGYNRCDAGGRIWSMRFSPSSSSGSCKIGRDWGVERRAVWVDNGCRATFYLEVENGRYEDDWRRDDDYGRDRNDIEYIKCQSDRQRYKLCRIYDDFSNVRLEDRHSDASCRQGTDWGTNRDGVWVNNGCRATFSYRIRGYRRY